MMQVLLIVLGVYAGACYGYGMYVIARLYLRRRVRPTAAGLLPGWLRHRTMHGASAAEPRPRLLSGGGFERERAHAA